MVKPTEIKFFNKISEKSEKSLSCVSRSESPMSKQLDWLKPEPLNLTPITPDEKILAIGPDIDKLYEDSLTAERIE